MAGGSGEQPDISAKPAETKQTVTLYFGDDQAMYLAPEQREVNKGDESLEAVIVRELINGPQKDGLTRTMPEGTKLLSVSVVNGVAYVNFSKEFKSKHWGGSAGESLTVYSVTNSLCKLPGIEEVQFLLEGDKQESILGNIGTIEPVTPDWDMVQE
ncbi:MAG: sporulation protein [Desulfotomaculum sp. BICA1-6]|nr:MAG: sporulation protein [Desulfotomaculum sp. BICA1-6]